MCLWCWKLWICTWVCFYLHHHELHVVVCYEKMRKFSFQSIFISFPFIFAWKFSSSIPHRMSFSFKSKFHLTLYQYCYWILMLRYASGCSVHVSWIYNIYRWKKWKFSLNLPSESASGVVNWIFVCENVKNMKNSNRELIYESQKKKFQCRMLQN